MLALQASLRERQLTILDLPLDLLKRVVDAVDSIWHLHTLAQVGLVSRSFAAVVKQQQHMTVFGRDLRKRYFKADRLLLGQICMCLNFVTSLELQQVEANQASSVLQLASSCRGLTILDVCFKHMPLDSVVDFMFKDIFVRGAANLQELYIRHDNGIQLKVVSPGGPLRQHDWLACIKHITAGSLSVLRGLSCCAAYSDMTDVSPLMTDQKVLSLLPALQWLEIGDEPLLTPFNGTVRGKLTNKTADTFLQATVSHVTGIYHNSLLQMDLNRPLNSITSWHSETFVSPTLIAQLAPNLTVLNIKIRHCSDPCVVLTPKLVSVDVSMSKHLGGISVRGVPTTALTHMCIKGHPLWLDRELYSWARARASQPHVVDLDVQVNLDESSRHVIMTSSCCTNIFLSELFIDFNHGCVAVTTFDAGRARVNV